MKLSWQIWVINRDRDRDHKSALDRDRDQDEKCDLTGTGTAQNYKSRYQELGQFLRNVEQEIYTDCIIICWLYIISNEVTKIDRLYYNVLQLPTVGLWRRKTHNTRWSREHANCNVNYSLRGHVTSTFQVQHYTIISSEFTLIQQKLVWIYTVAIEKWNVPLRIEIPDKSWSTLSLCFPLGV